MLKRDAHLFEKGERLDGVGKICWDSEENDPLYNSTDIFLSVHLDTLRG